MGNQIVAVYLSGIQMDNLYRMGSLSDYADKNPDKVRRYSSDEQLKEANKNIVGSGSIIKVHS